MELIRGNRFLQDMINIHILENEVSTPCHSHQFLELVYILSGSAKQHIGLHPGQLQAGDYFIIDYNTTHDYLSENKDLTLINCLFGPEFINDTFAENTSFNEIAARYFFKITGRRLNDRVADQTFHDTNGVVGEILKKMITEQQIKADGYLEMLRNYMREIIILTVRHIGSQQMISALTEQLIVNIQHHYSTKLTLKHLCQKLHYSLPYASAVFKNDTGMTFTAYLQLQRMEEACRLLLETDLPINTIAEQCGYSSMKLFDRFFKRHTGLNPRGYRKQKI